MVEISALLNRQIPYNNEVPILNRDDIDRISAEILRNYMPNVLASPMPINVEALIEKHFNLRLNFQSFSPDGSILGETIFADGYREIFSLDEDSGFFQKQCISVKRGMIWQWLNKQKLELPLQKHMNLGIGFSMVRFMGRAKSGHAGVF